MQMYDMHVTFLLQIDYFFVKMVLNALSTNETNKGKYVIFATGSQQLPV